MSEQVLNGTGGGHRDEDRVQHWWHDLTTATLLGTQRRRPPAAMPLPVELDQEADPETALLEQVALAGAMRAAAVRGHRVQLPQPAPADQRGLAPERAAQVLELVLAQPPGGKTSQEHLLGEWIRRCSERSLLVPPRLLPALLQVASSQAQVAAVVAGVLGERGHWLAGQSPRWAAALAEWAPAWSLAELQRDWHEISPAEREAALAAAHAENPSGAASLAQEHWAGLPAAQRTALLGRFDATLDADDEPLLELALDDRSVQVRREALAMLDRLPASARAHRMAQRLRVLLHPGAPLRLELPDAVDATAERDGLGRPPPALAARVHHVAVVAASAPLRVWQEVSGLRPHEVVEALDEPAWRQALARAAAAQRSSTWAEALLAQPDPSAMLLTPGLVAALDPAAADTCVTSALLRCPMQQWQPVLGGLPGPWSAATSRQALAMLGDPRLPAYQTEATFKAVADRLHPDCRAELEAWRAALDSSHPLSRPLARLITTFMFLETISEAFA